MKREYIKSLALLIVGVAALVIYIVYAIDVEKFLRVISGANALFAEPIVVGGDSQLDGIWGEALFHPSRTPN